MVVVAFAVCDQTFHEGDRLRESGESELLVYGVAGAGPAIEGAELLVDLVLRQERHGRPSRFRQRPNLAGRVAASSGAARPSSTRSATRPAVNGASSTPLR